MDPRDIESRHSARREKSPARAKEIFRAAALEAHGRGVRHGQPLHITSTWVRWSMRLSVLVVLVSALFVSVTRVGEYAEGIAVIQGVGRTVVTSAVSGTIQAIEVDPGERVVAGQVLAHLDRHSQRAEVERIERLYQQRLVEYLRMPSHEERRDQLAALDAERERARAQLKMRTIVAPEAGFVSDLRVQVGQLVNVADRLVSIEKDNSYYISVCLFPGHYRPLLTMDETHFFLELSGFPDSRHEVYIQSIADEVIGPKEAIRYLGREWAGSFNLSGPVVVVTARLPSNRFTSDSKAYKVYDGMQGKIEAYVRSETLIETVFPAFDK